MNNPSQPIPDVPAGCPYPWCTTDHAGAVHDPVHWTEPEQFNSAGEHAPLLPEQVRVQGSLNPDEVPPARIHVDSRLGDRDLWRAALILTPVEARTLAASVVLVAEIVGTP